jgi:hypothetical protein
MKIVIAGGSGFLGRALTGSLLADGHTVSILGRGAPDGGAAGAGEPLILQSIAHVAWSPDGTAGPWAAALDGVDAVVNLAGESIAASRWSSFHKARILESRLLATRSLVAAIKSVTKPPRVFISGSALGYYGSRGDDVLTEDAEPGFDFLAGVCEAWEREALDARPFVKRLILVRTSLVLDRNEGALPQMLTPFRLFAGGPVGSGRQYVSWIHRDDWVSLMGWALLNDAVDGPLNLTSPNPVRNAEFARTLGRVLGRPSVMPTPAFAAKLALGEMAESLLLSSQRVIPARAIALGFAFRFPDLDSALRDVLAA